MRNFTPPCKMNTLIVIERNVLTRDEIGGEVPSWAECTRLYCDILWGKGFERTNSEQLRPTAWCTITTRWEPGFDESCRVRVVDSQELLNIRSIRDVNNEHFWLEMFCESGIPS